MKLKLEQGQIWGQNQTYWRIVKWSRQAIEYKLCDASGSCNGDLIAVSKKAFCNLIKGAELMTKEKLAAEQALEGIEMMSQHPAETDPLTEHPKSAATP
jgi:hypothetical protein